MAPRRSWAKKIGNDFGRSSAVSNLYCRQDPSAHLSFAGNDLDIAESFQAFLSKFHTEA
jgi:hypothetical protein